MVEITTSGNHADLSFEARWEKALGQPELSIVDAKKLTIDASPSAILARLREVADLLHAKGELSEQAFTVVVPGKLQGVVGILKQRLRGGSE
jgi:hypothetical protein